MICVVSRSGAFPAELESGSSQHARRSHDQASMRRPTFRSADDSGPTLLHPLGHTQQQKWLPSQLIQGTLPKKRVMRMHVLYQSTIAPTFSDTEVRSQATELFIARHRKAVLPTKPRTSFFFLASWLGTPASASAVHGGPNERGENLCVQSLTKPRHYQLGRDRVNSIPTLFNCSTAL